MVQDAIDLQSMSTIQKVLNRQREFFQTGQTKDIGFRLRQLKALRQAVLDHQSLIVQALAADLRKPEFEAYATEVGVVGEIDHAIKHLKTWVKPTRVSVPLTLFPSSAQIIPEPLGVVLIISPWNYPFQLMISPLVGAIAAGNCAILKPSEVAPQTSQAIADLMQKTFDPSYITVVEGGVDTSQVLLQERYDHIFFTGGTEVGRIVMAAAAPHLTPVTLELGGKSPCIVDTDIHLDHAARRIVWGKFLNAGQTCIAPDYLFVNRKVKAALMKALVETVQAFYGSDPAVSPDYARLISDRHFERVSRLLGTGTTVVGGQTDRSDRYIAPTILDDVSPQDPVMQDEIFGPILPVLTYDDVEEAIAFVNERPKPLALYIFSRDTQVQNRVLSATSSGTVCINDTVMQVTASNLPFGGVGESGMGSYHGKSSFDTFSHRKSVLSSSFWLDIKGRYAPYAGKLDFLKKIMMGS
ncbi:MAG: aldehyde dehydrogenase [Synechococcales cyanobacterium K44_A2020_017]|nr:aldehyde dehydrogenase [Synechococcales cyanobacterium K32_A2020_035]MBF2094409.1 aldehyde dehydrogenase [Synechococcales cyanobacterium K44_A2020_017]